MAFWGFNFVVIRIGLVGVPPLLLSAARFLPVVVFAFVVPRPAVPLRSLAVTATFLFVGQYYCLFTAMGAGAPAGLASVILQGQAFFVILIQALMFNERPAARQLVGMALAALGMLLIARTVSTNASLTPWGFGLSVLAALFWGIGNVGTQRMMRVAKAPVDPLALIVWMSLIAMPALAALSIATEGRERIVAAVTGMSWISLGSILYIGAISTLMGFTVWARLLRRYPAGVVVPFTLLVPLFGLASGALVLGERLTMVQTLGSAIVFAGIVCVAFPTTLFSALRPKPTAS